MATLYFKEDAMAKVTITELRKNIPNIPRVIKEPTMTTDVLWEKLDKEFEDLDIRLEAIETKIDELTQVIDDGLTDKER